MQICDDILLESDDYRCMTKVRERDLNECRLEFWLRPIQDW